MVSVNPLPRVDTPRPPIGFEDVTDVTPFVIHITRPKQIGEIRIYGDAYQGYGWIGPHPQRDLATVGDLPPQRNRTITGCISEAVETYRALGYDAGRLTVFNGEQCLQTHLDLECRIPYDDFCWRPAPDCPNPHHQARYPSQPILE
jgi:hypothetical protein